MTETSQGREAAVSELIHAVRARVDVIRATVVTRNFQLEGDIHCPKLGKEGRRLSNMLNSERNFIAMTNVSVVNRANGQKDPKVYPLIQINLTSIEFIRPYLEADELATESVQADQSKTS